MLIGIAMMLVLVLYILGVMTFFGEYVTYENLKYLSRDFSAITLGGANTDFSSIVYNGRDDMSFAYFRGGMAMSNGDTLSYYDSSGIRLVEDTLSYTDPVIVGGERYMLVYDLGGVGYSVYNQLTKIIGREAGGKIVAGDIAEDGSSILVMRSHETKYVVEVYNAAFNKAMNIYKDNYVLDAAISRDGKRIIICSAVPSDTDFSCEIEICERGRGESITVQTYEHTMPLDVYASEDGFVLLCDRGIYFLDYDGKIIASHTFDGMSLRYADINESSVAIVGSTNALGNKNRVTVFDLAGAVLHDTVLDFRITGAHASRNLQEAKVYLVTSKSALIIDGAGDTIALESDSVGDIVSVVPMAGGALICRRDGASFAVTDGGFTDIQAET